MGLSIMMWFRSCFYPGNPDASGVQVSEIEVPYNATHDRMIVLRHSDNPSGPMLFFTSAEWHAFVDGIRTEELYR
ncbi:DUF397 domain-containing protein [Spongiactinospora sp. TRM90649]|uniref:DUF397 domain-containing protein n=1 Tax=Spongiactinospora sp. TRM90649 TaxID=3031114 RepID=UPI0023FA00F4|nr:DUF397 domain-containing protein [Spongiactinospora sp. TRM90649]MDF5756466.1 DUF397 domain-containing protein [Spongiactinospora sp. TRM90649]